jgi:rSAM/selenodomain-associated transferase 1
MSGSIAGREPSGIMNSVAIAIICKTPASGQSKTRLSAVLSPDDCAALSACFIRDVALTVDAVARGANAAPYAIYTPMGSEAALRPLLPESFRLLPQGDGDLSARLVKAVRDLFAAGHGGAILLNSDSPTLPAAILLSAVDAVHAGDSIVFGPALDGGYTLVGMAKPHLEIFADIPWSTPEVHRLSVERARKLGVPVVNVPAWYDVDDEASLRMLDAELRGERLPFAEAGLAGAEAPATRHFLAERILPARRARS